MANRRQYSDAEKAEYYRNKASQRSNFSGRNYSQNNSYQYSSNGGQSFKKSGATYTRITKGKMEGLMVVSAWKNTRTVMVKASAMPLDSKSTESANGNQYIPYLVTIIDMNTLQKSIYNGIMNIQSRVLVIKELGYCITPNGSGSTKRGTRVKGYFGKFVKS